MKVYIDNDEWYPVYSLTEREPGGYKFGVEAEISEKDLKFIDKAFADFSKAQDILRDASGD